MINYTRDFSCDNCITKRITHLLISQVDTFFGGETFR